MARGLVPFVLSKSVIAESLAQKLFTWCCEDSPKKGHIFRKWLNNVEKNPIEKKERNHSSSTHMRRSKTLPQTASAEARMLFERVCDSSMHLHVCVATLQTFLW
mmetsp:Transcript_112033/g.177002  ORF Transcript_112033/g.177002 Transcript_112033/m.177002 type:complete len:104 (-) Transcript_112033:803-1114(-)